MICEVVVYNIESALRAQEGGADRIELCDNPGDGGTTPSFGTIEVVRQNVSMDVYVMIRPRGGDFFYSNYEFHAMKRDISEAMRLSVDGVVLGMLTAAGRIDVARCRQLIARARPMKVTCHRAFDMARDPHEALQDCIDAGFDRILTSGGKPRAIAGIETIQSLVTAAAGKIIIMPGSGINEHNVREIVSKTAATEIHFSAVAYRDSNMQHRNGDIAGMGSAEGSEYQLRTVDANRIRAIRELAELTGD